MKYFNFLLLAVVALLPAVASAAVADTVMVDEVCYVHPANATYCQAFPADSDSKTLTVLGAVDFPDGKGGASTYPVLNISANAFQGSTELKSVKLEECTYNYPGSPRRFKVMEGAFAECPSLETVDLPADITYLSLDAFSGDKSLKSVVCRATEPPTVVAENASDLPSPVFYVPDVDAYRSSGISFWSSASTQLAPLEEYREEEGGENEAATVSIRMGNGRLVLPAMTAGSVLRFEADPGYEIFIDNSGSKGGVYEVPVPSDGGDIEIEPVFIMEGLSSEADVATIAAPTPRLRVSGGRVEISGAGDSEVTVFTAGGSELYSGHASVLNLTQGVYVIKVGDHAFKVAI